MYIEDPTNNLQQFIKLSVGGRVKLARNHKVTFYMKIHCSFQTTIGTLTKTENTMLKAMFGGGMEVLTDSEGKYYTIF